MAGYTRNDTSNNIATGNVINAADLDGEFDALVAAFHASTGHTHDGTAANGAPITKIGPVQDLVISTGAITPKTDNTVDLGSSSFEFKDLYIDGTANIDALVADTADINAGTIDGVVIGGSTTAAGSFTTLTTSSTVTLNGGTANGVLYLNGSKVATSGSALTFDGTNLGIGGTGDPFGRFYGRSAGLSSASSAFLEINAATGSSSGIDFGVNAVRTAGITSNTTETQFTTLTATPLLFGINGSEQMRLTSTGLGIGTSSPSTKLHIAGTAATSAITIFSTGTTTAYNVGQFTNTGGSFFYGVDNSAGNAFSGSSAYASVIGSGNSTNLNFVTNATVKATLDSSGNLGLGVTPSAWGSDRKAMQVNLASLSGGNGSNFAVLGNNQYNDGTNSRYIATAAASAYAQNTSGAHLWYTAPSGTAGNAITFTQAMTLDASGNLGIGSTTPSGTAGYRYVSILDGSTGSALSFRKSTNAEYGSLFATASDNSINLYATLVGPLIFGTSAVERARITSGGDLLVGTTSNPNNSKVVIAGSLTQNGAYINSSYNYTDISGTTYGLWRIQLLTGGGGRIDLSEYGTDVSTPNAAQYTITFYVTSGGTVNATSSRSYTNYANTVLLVKDSTYLYLAVSKGHPNGAGYWNVEFRGSNNSADLAFAHSSTISGYTTVYTV